ncbi:MAG: efflux RND transporter periplasmic adaptor subunit [Acidobacteriota bacterium]
MKDSFRSIPFVNTGWIRPLAPRLAALVVLGLLGWLQMGCTAGDTQASEEPSVGREAAAAEEAGAEEDDDTVPVEVAGLERGPIEAVLRFSTNLEAEQSVGVYSQASRQVLELLVEEGDRVSRGQLLLRLQDDEQRLQVAKVEGQLAEARREYERQKRLYEDALIPEQDFNQATYELRQLELQLEEAERQLSYTEVRAPIRGTVTRRLVNLGDTITVNQHLFDIVDFDTLVARVYAPEKELRRLEVGLPARIAVPALGGAEYRGEVVRLAPIVDPQSGTIKVTVGIPDWQGLRPGLYVDVALVTETHERALLVPKKALVYDQDQIFVYRLADGPTVERISLRPLLEDKNHVEPAGFTLEAGDRLVIAGQTGLKDGARVRVLPVAGASRETDAAPEPAR